MEFAQVEGTNERDEPRDNRNRVALLRQGLPLDSAAGGGADEKNKRVPDPERVQAPKEETKKPPLH